MALLAATQGTPERVWSLVRILAAHGGEMPRQDVADWLNPKFKQADYPTKDEKTAVEQTIQAALGLSLIDTSQRQVVRLLTENAGADFASFANQIHKRLLDLDPQAADAVVLEAYAWLVVECEIQRSTLWISDWRSDQFADRADEVLSKDRSPEADRRFNPTKRSPWRRWIEFLGLSTMLPNDVEYPSVTPRLTAQLSEVCPTGREIRADNLIDLIGASMPYLDRGRLFEEACQRCGVQPPSRTVSRVLSAALRDMADEGQLKLIFRGDSRDGLRLSDDPLSRWSAFTAAVFEREPATAMKEAAHV